MIKPPWLIKPNVPFQATAAVRDTLADGRLNTVCRSARCPNMGECYSKGTATFMILGEECSRSCGFCAVPHGRAPSLPDPDEPERVAQAAARMGLEHVVVTSVTRDDLPDGGAGAFAQTIAAIRRLAPGAVVEALTPDFRGVMDAVDAVAAAGPAVYNHNLETVEELYPRVRPQADYHGSLELLAHVRSRYPEIIVKSGFMLGLGETMAQTLRLMADLRGAGCQILTIGQYLRPSRANLPVAEYIRPEVFEELKAEGEGMGFAAVFSGPFVRSSYMAKHVLRGALAEDR